MTVCLIQRHKGPPHLDHDRIGQEPDDLIQPRELRESLYRDPSREIDPAVLELDRRLVYARWDYARECVPQHRRELETAE